MKPTIRCLILMPAVLMFLSSDLAAAPITYTFETVTSGEIGDVAFTDQPVVITTMADTDNIITESFGYFVINDSATIQIGGTTYDIANTTSHAFNNTFGSATFGNDDVGIDSFVLENGAFSTYDGSTSLGPIVGGAFIDSGVDFDTVGGSNIEFDGGFPITTTFTATLIPEPASVGLLALGGLMLLFRRGGANEARA